MSPEKSGKDLLRLTEELVNIRSDRSNPAMRTFLKKALAKNGWKNIREKGGNVWGSIGAGKRVILYDIHSDTIPAHPEGWAGDPFKARLSKGKLYGRGTVDDKGPLAAAIFSGNFIRDSKDYKVYLLAADKEETNEGYGCRVFLKTEKVKPDFVLISEPSDLQLVFGQRGRIEITLTARGTPAHGSMPEKGKNAILMLNEAISAIGKIKFRALPPFTATTIAPTVIKSEGEGKNVLPLSCSVLLDIRMNHRESAESIIQILRRTLPEGIDIKTGNFCPAWLLQNADYARAAKKTFAQAYGKNARPAYWKFCTNGSSYASRGIPVIGFGPGKPELCHKKNEHIKTADIEKAVNFFRLLPSRVAEAEK